MTGCGNQYFKEAQHSKHSKLGYSLGVPGVKAETHSALHVDQSLHMGICVIFSCLGLVLSPSPRAAGISILTLHAQLSPGALRVKEGLAFLLLPQDVDTTPSRGKAWQPAQWPRSAATINGCSAEPAGPHCTEKLGG